MSRDGNGLYSLPANTLAVSGEVISSTKFNTLVQDLETDMNTDRPVVAGGTGASTAAGARTNLGLAKAVETKSAGYTADGDDRNKLLFFDTTATLSLTAAATLGSDWAVTVLADSGVTITVDPDGAETVNGSATAAVAAGEHATIFCTGTEFHMLVGADDMTGAEIKALYEAEADTNAYTDAEQTKVGHISVTQAVDLDQMETDIAALANGMVYKGDWDASAGTFPGSGAAQTGWFYYVSVAGTVDSVDFAVGDNIVAITDNASTGTYAANWSKHDQTDAVQAVDGNTGSITSAQLMTSIQKEDGAGSGLDADLLDGVQGSGYCQTANNLSDVANASTARTNLGVAIGTDVQAYDADTAKLDVENQTFSGGLEVTEKDLGTKSSGTHTMDVADRPLQYLTNGGAFTLAPGTVGGSCLLLVTNNASAGAITTSGFTFVDGDDFSTTNGDDFLCQVTVVNSFSILTVKALQ